MAFFFIPQFSARSTERQRAFARALPSAQVLCSLILVRLAPCHHSGFGLKVTFPERPSLTVQSKDVRYPFMSDFVPRFVFFVARIAILSPYLFPL